MRTLLVSFMLATLAGHAIPVYAAKHAMSAKDIAHIVFSEAERLVIERYFKTKAADNGQADSQDKKAARKKAKRKGKGKKKGLPPGLAKRQSLPPGLAKRKTLPPGLAKRDLPPDLLGQLPPTREGIDRAIVDNNVVLIEAATGKVLDILEHVLTK
ncbi:MAG: hypothetical protein DRQ37_02060 [Gammaproteobacteria bacterium]|nr:MAG: hypothetical protein DRQ37_02060 [Gammaproteobacteria bacterium]